MIKSVIFSDKQGMGYVADNEYDIYDIIDEESISINNKVLKPGDLTTLDNYFIREVRFLGVSKENENEMVFAIGDETDLFNNEFYYNSIIKISETRIFECFAYGSGRDHIFVNGNWK